MIVAFLIALCILAIVAYWKIFEKAGEKGWKCLIPFYGSYILYKIVWGNGWFFLLSFVPIANIVVGIMLQIKMAASFGKSAGFIAGLILLPFIFNMIIAFGDSRYLGPNGGNYNNSNTDYNYNQNYYNPGNGGYTGYGQDNSSYTGYGRDNSSYTGYGRGNGNYTGYGRDNGSYSGYNRGNSEYSGSERYISGQNDASGYIGYVRDDHAYPSENRNQSVAQQQLEEPKRHFCPNCGQPVSENAKFCRNCGHPLSRQRQQ